MSSVEKYYKKLKKKHGQEPEGSELGISGIRLGEKKEDYYGPVTAVAFSHDGKYLATGSKCMAIEIWDAKTLESQRVFTILGGTIRSLAFSHDDAHLASVGDDTYLRWWSLVHLDDEKEPISVAELDRAEGERCVAFSPNGKYVACGSSEHVIELFDLKNMDKSDAHFELEYHTSTIHSVAFSRDGNYLASASADKTVKVLDIRRIDEKGYEPVVLPHARGLRGAVFMPDGKHLLSGCSDMKLWLWDRELMQDVDYKPSPINSSVYWAHSMAVSPDGKRFATGSGDGRVRTWNIEYR